MTHPTVDSTIGTAIYVAREIEAAVSRQVGDPRAFPDAARAVTELYCAHMLVTEMRELRAQLKALERVISPGPELQR